MKVSPLPKEDILPSQPAYLADSHVGSGPVDDPGHLAIAVAIEERLRKGWKQRGI